MKGCLQRLELEWLIKIVDSFTAELEEAMQAADYGPYWEHYRFLKGLRLRLSSQLKEASGENAGDGDIVL